MDQGPQHKARYPESDRENVGDKCELIDTGKDCLNRISIALAL